MIQEIKNVLWHLPKAIISCAWYRFPAKKLRIIGVTGTKGKTTTCHMIYHILKTARLRAGLISTIGAYFGDQEIDTGLHVTSPDPRELQKLLRIAVDRGVTYIVLEVTSSGLDQFRVWGIKFKVAVITNIEPDHLDYHGSMERYIMAKAKIISQSKMIVLDESMPYFGQLQRYIRPETKLFTFRTENLSPTQRNKRASVEVTRLIGVPLETATLALKSFPGVAGRFETVYNKSFRIVIDFAHTPSSLKSALKELREMVKKGGRLVAVFGCAGERDPGRRLMGAVAAKLADFFIITAEDPRSESVDQISSEIASYAAQAGAAEGKDYIRISDRQDAINKAILMAKQGDVVGLLGKGHEKSMCYGKKELPWSEHESVKKALVAWRKYSNKTNKLTN